MGRRGKKRQLVVEAEYWALILAGVGTVEACRRVGITRKTGYRWRAERGGLPPMALAETGRSSRYLSLLERQRIAVLHGQGLSLRGIAARMGRAPSTVSRELNRNMRRHDGGVYDAVLAHARSRAAARRQRSGRLAQDAELRAAVQGQLELDWSPEQIAAWLKSEHPDRPGWHLCHETIYQALYHGGKGGLSRTLTVHLRTGRPLRKRRRRPDSRRPRFLVESRSISDRPTAVESRERVGDWEGDLIVGRQSRSAIGTLVERNTRYVRLVHLPAGHSAEAVATAMTAAIDDLPAAVRLTLTWDQGSEMARHDLLSAHFGGGVYFADPGCPWQRGTNENTNGLLRQYFPKGADLNRYGPEDLARVEKLLNTRPRRTLAWATPAQLLAAAVAP
jgi:transposase, IS30 family